MLITSCCKRLSTFFAAGPKTGNLFLLRSVRCLLNIGQGVTDVLVSIDGTFLSFVNFCRDLGVTVTSDLSPSLHINNIVAKVHARANAIHRCFVSRNTQGRRLYIFKVFVEYPLNVGSGLFQCFP